MENLARVAHRALAVFIKRSRRATFERERRQKMERNVRAMADDVKTVSYRRFAARIGRSKFNPNVCQREGKR